MTVIAALTMTHHFKNELGFKGMIRVTVGEWNAM